MSGTRQAAFARVPRGKTPTKKSAGPTRIDATWLKKFDHLSVNPDLASVMTKTQASLALKVGPQGGTGYALENTQGKVLADAADIVRIQTLNANITRERKEAQKGSVSLNLRYILAAMVRVAESPEIGLRITSFPPQFVEVYRSVNVQFGVLSKNLVALESVQVLDGTAHAEIKNIFAEMGQRAIKAQGDYLLHRARLVEGTTPDKLNKFLFERHVPIAVYNRLTTAVINVTTQGFDIRSLFFPSDPTKGVYLTWREVNTQEFRDDLIGLLKGSALMLAIARNARLVQNLINVPETQSVTNFTEVNSLAAKMANTPFYVLPWAGCVEVTHFFNYLAKNGVRGINWNSGAVLSPQDLLKYAGTIAKRILYGFILRPQLKAGLIGEMFPGFEFDIANAEQDIYVQLKAWAQTRPGTEATWFQKVAARDVVFTRDFATVVKKVFNDVVLVPAGHGVAQRFVERLDWLRGNDPGWRLDGGENVTGPFFLLASKNLAATLTMQGENPAAIIGDRFTGSLPTAAKDKTNKRVGLMERSMLTSKAASAVALIRQRGYGALASRMQAWFRNFLDTSIQEAVADLFLARLDAFLAMPVEQTRQERLAFMEPDDFDDGQPVEEDQPEDPGPEEERGEDDA